MATIRKRGTRQWEAQIRKYGWPTVSKTFITKADAEAWAEVIESEMTRGIFIDRTEAERNTLGDLLLRYLREVTPLKKGAASETYRIYALLKDPIANHKVAALSGSIMSAWRDQRLKSVSGSTTNRDLNLLCHVINVARKEWGIHIENPITMIRRPSENKSRCRRLSADEESRLQSALEATERDEQGRFTGPQNIWLKPIVILAIETAMRRGEILSLRWEHVHVQERYVRLLDTKNGEQRDVPLSSKAVTVLQNLPRQISGEVFPVSAEALKKAFTRAVSRAGIQDLRFHDLRHEATSRLAEKLDNVLELSAVTGHKTLNMLHRYYHPKASVLAMKLG